MSNFGPPCTGNFYPYRRPPPGSNRFGSAQLAGSEFGFRGSPRGMSFRGPRPRVGQGSLDRGEIKMSTLKPTQIKESKEISSSAEVIKTEATVASKLMDKKQKMSEEQGKERGEEKCDAQIKEEPLADVQLTTVKVKEEAVKIRLDTNNSELHVHFEDDDLTMSIMRGEGFEYMWGGARATHGVTHGKVCFEVHLLENQEANLPDDNNLHITRVGWSVDGSDFQLGEDKLSWGYGGTGKSVYESKFRDYGKVFGKGDVVTCYIDLNATPKAIFYMVNGEYLGVAFRFTNELGNRPVYPHITCKNMKVKFNFGDQPYKFPLTNGFTMIQNVAVNDLVLAPPGPTKPEEAEVIMMVGLPASGKSFWCEKYAEQHPDKKYYILGTNFIIDRMKVSGLLRKRNYHGRWEELIKRASAVLNKLFDVAKKRPKNYILDQTNVYFTARRRKMESFRGYKRIAAVLVNKPNVLEQRKEKQKQIEGKVVPDEAIMEMKRNFTLPDKGPSFDDVWYLEELQEPARKFVEAYRREGEEYKKTLKSNAESVTTNTKPPSEKKPRTELQTTPNPESKYERQTLMEIDTSGAKPPSTKASNLNDILQSPSSQRRNDNRRKEDNSISPVSRDGSKNHRSDDRGRNRGSKEEIRDGKDQRNYWPDRNRDFRHRDEPGHRAFHRGDRSREDHTEPRDSALADCILPNKDDERQRHRDNRNSFSVIPLNERSNTDPRKRIHHSPRGRNYLPPNNRLNMSRRDREYYSPNERNYRLPADDNYPSARKEAWSPHRKIKHFPLRERRYSPLREEGYIPPIERKDMSPRGNEYLSHRDQEYPPPRVEEHMPSREGNYRPLREERYPPPREDAYLQPLEREYLPPRDERYLPQGEREYQQPEKREHLPPREKYLVSRQKEFPLERERHHLPSRENKPSDDSRRSLTQGNFHEHHESGIRNDGLYGDEITFKQENRYHPNQNRDFQPSFESHQNFGFGDSFQNSETVEGTERYRAPLFDHQDQRRPSERYLRERGHDEQVYPGPQNNFGPSEEEIMHSINRDSYSSQEERRSFPEQGRDRDDRHLPTQQQQQQQRAPLPFQDRKFPPTKDRIFPLLEDRDLPASARPFDYDQNIYTGQEEREQHGYRSEAEHSRHSMHHKPHLQQFAGEIMSECNQPRSFDKSSYVRPEEVDDVYEQRRPVVTDRDYDEKEDYLDHDRPGIYNPSSRPVYKSNYWKNTDLHNDRKGISNSNTYGDDFRANFSNHYEYSNQSVSSMRGEQGKDVIYDSARRHPPDDVYNDRHDRSDLHQSQYGSTNKYHDEYDRSSSDNHQFRSEQHFDRDSRQRLGDPQHFDLETQKSYSAASTNTPGTEAQASLYTSNSNQSYKRSNDQLSSSYNTQMTTSTANYSRPSHLSQYISELAGNLPSQTVNPEPKNYQSLSTFSSSQSSEDTQTKVPVESQNALSDVPTSYEQQQEDYQKAYSQWYANYAQAFARIAQSQSQQQ